MAGGDAAMVQTLLSRAGILPAVDTAITLVPLTGGVSCDVWRVDAGGQVLCVVKRALAQLRVKADWFAPVDRTESEVRWLKQAGSIVPHLCPKILAEDADQHIFAMEFLPPESHPVWKDALFAGVVDVDFAAAVGRDLAKVHGATAHDPTIAREFDTGVLFTDLRIDPFLRYVADKQPAVAPRLRALADDLAQNRTALVHGDVSPKNILIGPSGPVLLDAECAVYGDPAFDVAFCTTHLLLKIVHLADNAPALRASALALAQAYLERVDWEAAEAISTRISALTAALLLARIDGKSPASYIEDESEKQRIRAAALACLSRPPARLPDLIASWPLDGEFPK